MPQKQLKPIRRIFRLLFKDVHTIVAENAITGEIVEITGDKYRQKHMEYYQKKEEEIKDEKPEQNIMANNERWEQWYEQKQHRVQNARDMAYDIEHWDGEENTYLFLALNDFFKTQVAHGGHVLAYVDDKTGVRDFKQDCLDDKVGYDFEAIYYDSQIKNGKLIFKTRDDRSIKELQDLMKKERYDVNHDKEKFNDTVNMLDFYKRYTLDNKVHVLHSDKEPFLLFQESNFTVLLQSIEEFTKDKEVDFDFKTIAYNKTYLSSEFERDDVIATYVEMSKRQHQLNENSKRR